MSPRWLPQGPGGDVNEVRKITAERLWLEFTSYSTTTNTTSEKNNTTTLPNNKTPLKKRKKMHNTVLSELGTFYFGKK